MEKITFITMQSARNQAANICVNVGVNYIDAYQETDGIISFGYPCINPLDENDNFWATIGRDGNLYLKEYNYKWTDSTETELKRVVDFTLFRRASDHLSRIKKNI